MLGIKVISFQSDEFEKLSRTRNKYYVSPVPSNPRTSPNAETTSSWSSGKRRPIFLVKLDRKAERKFGFDPIPGSPDHSNCKNCLKILKF
jgi:hypothetical protein